MGRFITGPLNILARVVSEEAGCADVKRRQNLVGRSPASQLPVQFVSATEAYYIGDRKDITKPVHLK